MSKKLFIIYYDRYSKMLKDEKIYADGFLYWMYNTGLGQIATEVFIKRKVLSKLYGWFHRRRLSKRKITAFIKGMDIDMEEQSCLLEEYSTFNDFFIREINLAKRAIRTEPHICIAPVDGRALVYPSIEEEKTFLIKRSPFNLRAFVGDNFLADMFSGGSMSVIRLSLRDYHHFHFPDGGIPSKSMPIRGVFHAGGPYSLQRLIPFFNENFRVCTLFKSDHFGTILLCEVGALTVGSIQQRYEPGIHVSKGDHKGFFELGSTVVLLFKRGVIEFDEDLRINTQHRLETYVRFGDSIGRLSGTA